MSVVLDSMFSSDKKIELKKTTYSSSGKKYSPNLQKFYNFKEDFVGNYNGQGRQSLLSPKISNFTI